MTTRTKRLVLTVVLSGLPPFVLGLLMPLDYFPATVGLGLLTSLVGTEVVLRLYPMEAA